MIIGVGLYTVIAVLLFAGSSRQDDVNDQLSKRTGVHLRAVSCLMVLVGHLFAARGSITWFYADQAGACGVAMFFFLSGYGLVKSMGEDYMRGFLFKKAVKLWVPIILLFPVYYLLYNYLILYPTEAYRGIINLAISTFHGDTIIQGSWYLITLSWFYLAFWGAYKYTFSRGRRDWKIFCVIIFIAYLLYIARVFTEGAGFIWMYTPHMFIVGMLWSINEKKLKEARILRLVLFLIAIAGIVLAGRLEIRSRGGYVLATILLSSGSVFVMLFVTMHLRIGNKVTELIGRHSFGIYLIHWLFYYSLDRFLDNTILWLILSLALAIGVGIPVDIGVGNLSRSIISLRYPSSRRIPR